MTDDDTIKNSINIIHFTRRLLFLKLQKQMNSVKLISKARKNIESTYEDFEFSVESVVEEEVVSHSDAVRLHRVALSIVVIAHCNSQIQNNLLRLVSKYSPSES